MLAKRAQKETIIPPQRSRNDSFFNLHPKRQTAVKPAIDDVQPESSTIKLGHLRRIRWIQRPDWRHEFKWE